MSYLSILLANRLGMRILAFALAVFPAAVHAQSAAAQRATEILCRIFDVVYAVALVVGIIYAVVAGFKYTTAAGDASKVSEAHRSLLYAMIGIGVVIIADGVPGIVASIIGGDAPGGC
jgi:heme/copper-type cytochrome/quinol oxidase subunit 2